LKEDFFDKNLLIHTFPSSYLRSNSYLLESNGHAAVIDPCRNVELFSALKNFKIDFCLLTHEHYDHINGANELRKRFGSPIICSKICANRIRSPRLNAAHYYPAFIRMQTQELCTEPIMIDTDYCCEADQVFEFKHSFSWQGHRIILKETPGHSPGSICILFDEMFLFVGDTLAASHLPYARFPGGNAETFNKYTLPFLKSLPPEVIVYPGHYGSFPLKDAALQEL